MTNQHRDRVVAAFERELASSPIPQDLRANAVHTAVSRGPVSEPRTTSRWATVVAAALAVAIVVTLVIGGRYLNRVPATQTLAGNWQAKQLVSVPGGFRAATYDPGCNCLWILTRTSVQADVLIAQLTRFNIGDGSTVPSVLEFPTTGSGSGAVAVGSNGWVWSTWGRTLAMYDPGTKATRHWTLPNLPPDQVTRSSDGLDGYGVALTVGADGEVWLAAEGYRALFGFNPTVGTWDRTIPLPLIPTGGTTLAVPQAGIVTINGVKTVGGPTPEPRATQSRTGRSAGYGVLVVVNTKTNVFSVLPPHVNTYVLLDSNNVVYLDEQGAFFKLNLSSGQSKLLASKAPTSRALPLAVDRAGNIWFSMVAFRSVGVGRVNQSSGAITTFPFPYIHAPGSPEPNDCPTGAFDCIPSSAVFDPEIQAIVIDAGNNVWVIDMQPDTGAPAPSVAGPIYELRAGS